MVEPSLRLPGSDVARSHSDAACLAVQLRNISLVNSLCSASIQKVYLLAVGCLQRREHPNIARLRLVGVCEGWRQSTMLFTKQ